jgi:DNA invertase Pin-like site-specific DNA recombinase
VTNTNTPAVPAPDREPNAVRTVISYARVADPRGQGSIQAQRKDLDVEATFDGWRVAERIDDLGQPGTTLERPGLAQALEQLAQHKADALMVCELTRLSRSAAVTRLLAAHGWQLVVVRADR